MRKPQGNTKVLRVLISDEDDRFLEALATTDGTNVSEIVRRLIKQARDKTAKALVGMVGN